MTTSEPEFLVAALSELTEALYRDLDEAVRIAGGHFREYDMTDATYHAGQSHLARCHARRLLQLSQADGELGGWVVAPPAPNVQVCLNRQQLQLRMLRPDKKQVPKPGTNDARIAWFSNHHDTLGGIESSRLIGLWALNDESEVVVRVVRTSGEARWGQRNRIDVDITLPRLATAVEDLEFRPFDAGEIELPFEQGDEETGTDNATGTGP